MRKRLLHLLGDTLAYGVSGMLSQIINFALLPLYTRYLQPADYGVLAMLAFVPLVFGTLAVAGLKSALFQQFFRSDDVERRRVVLSTAVVAAGVSATGILCASLAGAGYLSLWLIGDASQAGLVRLSLLTAFLVTLTEVPLIGFQAARKAKLVGLLNVVQVLVVVSSTIYFVVFRQLGVRGVVLGSLIGTTAFSSLCFLASRRSFASRIDSKIWREMTAYSLPFLPHRLQASLMIFWGDYMIRTHVGLADLGLYNVATRIVVPIGFISGAIQQAWNPYKFRVFAEEKDPSGFFRSTLTYFVCFLSYLWIGVSAWGPEVVRLMTAPPFHAASYLIWAVALMRSAQAFYPMMATGVELGDNTRAVPLASLASLIAAILSSVLLVPRFEALGAALSTTIAWMTLAAGYFLIAQRQIRVAYDWTAVAKLLAAATLLVGVVYTSQTAGPTLRLSLAIVCSVAFPLIAVVILHQSPCERDRIVSLLAGVRKRFHSTVAVSK